MSLNSIGGYSNQSSGMKWIFSSQSSQSGSGAIFPNVSDYNLIKSGAYKKLLNSYYGNATRSKTISDNSDSLDSDKKEKINLVAANTDSKALASSIADFSNVTVTNENREELKSNFKKVVENYNKLIDSGSEVDDHSVLRNVLWMTKGTSENSGLLADIGITVGEGNKLSFDESKFDSASLSDVSTLTKGKDSFFGRVMNRALTVSRESATAVNRTMSGSVYSKNGMMYGEINPSAMINRLT
ncbi:MAG: flagellar filament capping protein FliD [Lachnospiraceae bacterium]|nr:flagellar filament capping protein FliD [Lachnospiraceae bacterium]